MNDEFPQPEDAQVLHLSAPVATDSDPDAAVIGPVAGPVTEPVPEPEPATETVTEPAKVMRIGSMVKQLLEEARTSPLDEASRERMAEIYERSIVELGGALSPDLQQELHMLALPFKDGVVPSEGELRVAKAQLVGWLEGLFHGIQFSLLAQQNVARQQLEQMRQLSPSGVAGGQAVEARERPGTYL